MLKRWHFFVLCPLLLAAAPATAPSNLAGNGNFEKDAAWQFMAANGAQSAGEYDTTQAHEGGRSYHLSNKSAKAPHVYGRIFQFVRGLQPFTTYRISAWSKGTHVGLVWIGGGPGWQLRFPLPTGTYDWKESSIEFTTDENADDFELMIALEDPTESIWIDDVRMEAVRVDEQKKSAVMSRLNSRLGAEKIHLQKTLAGLSDEQRNDPYLLLRVSLAQRFIDRIEHAEGVQSLQWSFLQLDEVKQVLNDREFGAIATPEPIYLGGYGHFQSAMRDIPIFPGLGASLVQNGRIGPSSIDERGNLNESAQAIKDNLDLAEQYGVKVDFLLSPHYFPKWAMDHDPDIAVANPGFISFNIDHPKAREAISKFVDAIAPKLQHQPALLSICLSNEPVYAMSGRDKFSRDEWTKFLRNRFGAIDRLNALYGTAHVTYEEIDPPAIGMPKEIPAQRAYFDWVQFNQQHFANWHGWLRDLVKAKLPRIETHAKIMVFFAFDRDKLHFGIDPELMCDAADVAGCDAYAFVEGEWAYNFLGQEFFYDLLHSFRGQPVFNSENHLIPDGSPPRQISGDATRSAIWQGGLHHQTATTIWVWEEPTEPALAGSIYLRPANIYGAGRAMLDLNRWPLAVRAINEARPRVGLLYSPTSIFWEEKNKSTIMSIYTMLTFLGEPITFVSERQLTEQNRELPAWIILPQVTHVTNETVYALQRHLAVGGKVILVGDGNLAFDQYHRERQIPKDLAAAATLKLDAIPQATAKALHDIFNNGGSQTVDLMTDHNQPAWGIEYRAVKLENATIMPIINLAKSRQIVRLPKEMQGNVRDLLSDDAIEADRIILDSAVPRLLRIEAVP